MERMEAESKKCPKCGGKVMFWDTHTDGTAILVCGDCRHDWLENVCDPTAEYVLLDANGNKICWATFEPNAEGAMDAYKRISIPFMAEPTEQHPTSEELKGALLITCDGHTTHVWINGVEQKFVDMIVFTHRAGYVPRICISKDVHAATAVGEQE